MRKKLKVVSLLPLSAFETITMFVFVFPTLRNDGYRTLWSARRRDTGPSGHQSWAVSTEKQHQQTHPKHHPDNLSVHSLISFSTLFVIVVW